jgi:hypothetical protein
MPPTYEILSASLQRLGLTNVCAFPYAVSDRDGAATKEIPRFAGVDVHPAFTVEVALMYAAACPWILRQGFQPSPAQA